MDSEDRSEARELLSRLSDAFGGNGVFVVGKGPGSEGADLAPSSALTWPPCECGKPVCPDYDPEKPMRAKLTDRNRRSSRGGL
ncbi:MULTISPECIES: hypothetical protein [unclassified Streptomyces]|uniref:hypothetical protein n=1 Tax=unclassified Streptomyces TaxID=2593676 RepID=UPI002E2A6A6B|nr:hypothetical protein [Streptomyces sp. NBC_01429]